MPYWLILLIVGIVLVVAARYWIGDAQFSRWAYGGGVLCIVIGVIFFVLELLALAPSPVVRGAATFSPLALAGGAFLLGAIDPVPPNPPPSTGGPSYSVAFYAAWLNAAVGIVAAVLAGMGLTLHPSWLSGDVAATAGVVSAISLGLATILPQIQKTPAARELKYLAATQGVLPTDVARKYPLIVPAEPPLSAKPADAPITAIRATPPTG